MDMDPRTETLRIEGMSCGHCVRAVRTTLEGIEGVEVEDVQIGEARVRYDAGQTDRHEIEAALEEGGYPVAG